MAPRRTQRIAVHRSKAEEYRSVAENFFGGAEVAKEYAYWNASGAEMRKAMTTLRRIIDHKNAVSYSIDSDDGRQDVRNEDGRIVSYVMHG